MGRPRKPSEQLMRSGQFRLDRHGDRQEPRAVGEPVRLRGLDRYARQLWDHLVPKLVQLGVATDVDGPALQALCEWWSECRQARESTGHQYRRVIMMATAWKQFSSIASRFGLTPADWANLRIQTQPETDDPFDAYLRSRGLA